MAHELLVLIEEKQGGKGCCAEEEQHDVSNLKSAGCDSSAQVGKVSACILHGQQDSTGNEAPKSSHGWGLVAVPSLEKF